jgi:transposase-like protein
MATSKTESKRRRWSRKQRQRLLTKFHQSQLTQSEFASQHGVGLSTLSKWLRSEREAVPPKIKFQEVRLPNPATRGPVEIISPQGWSVRVPHGSDVQLLPELLRALPC